MHPVCEQLLMMTKHVWPTLTELCLLLVLHDWRVIAGGDNTQAAYAGRVTVNVFQGVGMVEQIAKMFTILLLIICKIMRILKI